jgi:hypothetical protein
MKGLQIQMSTNASVLSDSDVDKVIMALENRMQHLFEEKVLHRKDAAKFLGIGIKSLDRLASGGKVPYHRIDGLSGRVYLRSELIHLIRTS